MTDEEIIEATPATLWHAGFYDFVHDMVKYSYFDGVYNPRTKRIRRQMGDGDTILG